MLASYQPLLILLAFATFVPLAILLTARILGPKVGSPIKVEPYECGVPPVSFEGQSQHIRFYRLAILFLLFDVEVALLLPWAVVFKPMMPVWGLTFLVVEFAIFMTVLFVGYIYAWQKGALEWD